MTEAPGAGESIDELIATLYGCLSGPSELERPWNRFRACFWPGARLMPVRAEISGRAADVFDVEGYISSRAPFLEKNDFFETEVGRRTWSFGAIAHTLSAYEAKRSPGGAAFLRGVNSMQFFHDRVRWWILSVVWDNEAAANPPPGDPFQIR